MEDFVPHELAVKLKEKGFREECLCHYIGNDLFYNIESPIANKQLWFSHNKFDNIWHRDNYDAPTISQVLKWLKKEKKLHIGITPQWQYTVYDMRRRPWIGLSDMQNYDDDTKAFLAGIEYCLDNLI